MKLIAEYHTHTFYSDGKSSMRDNIEQAISIGLKTIGISDHGYKHMGFGVKYKNIPKMREEIEKLKQEFKEIEILLGVEANILDDQGRIDVDDSIRKYYDYVMAGYHFGSTPTSWPRGLYSHFCNRFKFDEKRAKEYNTKAMVNALRKNDIFILTHPGAKAPINLLEVALEAKKNNTALEVNERHVHLTYEEILSLKDTGVKFSIGSDAHKKEDVGSVEDAIERLKKANISSDRIINILK